MVYNRLLGAAALGNEDGFGVGGASPARLRTKKAAWRSGRAFVLARWQRRAFESQVFGVVRHAERADSWDAYYMGGRWTQTEDYRRWPLDPPLSDAGVDAAYRDVGQRIANFAQENGAHILVVVTSPYFRCVQTAVEVCRALGPRVRLLIDNALGEVYGPSVMGERTWESNTRPMGDLLNYCRNRKVKCVSTTVGKWPEWGENLQSARRRYAERFLTYLHRSTLTRRNFVIVTHGDCVGATATMMPSQAGTRLERVEYGGMFLAKRRSHGHRGAPSSASVVPAPLSSVVPAGPAEDDHEPDEEARADKPRRPAPEESWASEPEGEGQVPAFPREFLSLSPPKASDGWNVETYDLAIRAKGCIRAAAGFAFTKKLSTLIGNKFSKKQVETLLGELSDRPLGDTGETISSPPQPRDVDPLTGRSATNFSTMMFGTSFGTQSELGDSQVDDTDGEVERLVSGSSLSQVRRRAWPKTPSGAQQPKALRNSSFGRMDEETEVGEHMEAVVATTSSYDLSFVEAWAAKDGCMATIGAPLTDEMLTKAVACAAADERQKILSESKRTISVEKFGNEDAEAARPLAGGRRVHKQTWGKSPTTSPALMRPFAESASAEMALAADACGDLGAKHVSGLGPTARALPVAMGADAAAGAQGVHALASGLQNSKLMQRRLALQSKS